MPDRNRSGRVLELLDLCNHGNPHWLPLCIEVCVLLVEANDFLSEFIVRHHDASCK